jgi:hypothetical protein
MNPNIVNWGWSWVWGLSLVVLTVVVHASALSIMGNKVASVLGGSRTLRNRSFESILLMGAAALSAALLHGLEVAIWAGAYRLLGGLQGNKSAMLYSMNAMTSYGHDNLQLQGNWQMMGALEALNGWILFGLTTAFLFTVMQKVRPRTSRSTKPDISEPLRNVG